MTGIEEANSSQKQVNGGSIREGAWYWVRVQDREGRPSMGLIVMAAWMLSKRKYHTPYIRLYNSLGWDCLICESNVLNLWLSNQATAFARKILDELVKEVEHRKRPIVFASFSGGAKAFLYKLLQILQRKTEDGSLVQKHEVVGACAAGQIYDSSPMDFQGRIGAKFVKAQLHGSPIPNVALDVVLGAAATVIQSIFHSMWEAQRLEYWKTLHASGVMGPILILCSKIDKLAPFDEISKFSFTMRSLGFMVTLNSWEDSDHVGHYRIHPSEYKTAVKILLANAYTHYLQRIKNSNTSFDNALSDDPVSRLSRSRVKMQTNYAIKNGTLLAEAHDTGMKSCDSCSHQSFNFTSVSQFNLPSEQSNEIVEIPGWNISSLSSKRSRL